MANLSSGNCGQVLWGTIELQAMPSKTANNFNILNCRPAKFGIGNVYGLLYKVRYRLVIIVFGDIVTYCVYMHLYACVYSCCFVLLRIDHESLIVLCVPCKDSTNWRR